MDTFTVQPVTAETLPDLVALIVDREDAARRLNFMRERLAGGQLKLENTLILRSERGVEGHALINAVPQIPVFPHLRSDAPEEAVKALACAILDRVGPGQQLFLDSNLAPFRLRRSRLPGGCWTVGTSYTKPICAPELTRWTRRRRPLTRINPRSANF